MGIIRVIEEKGRFTVEVENEGREVDYIVRCNGAVVNVFHGSRNPNAAKYNALRYASELFEQDLRTAWLDADLVRYEDILEAYRNGSLARRLCLLDDVQLIRLAHTHVRALVDRGTRAIIQYSDAIREVLEQYRALVAGAGCAVKAREV